MDDTPVQHGRPAHHRDGGFVNLDPGIRIGGDFWRWQRERRAAGLPAPPRAGYAAFAERWLVTPDFDHGCAGTRPVAWWLGHATVLVRMGGAHLITDPHFSRRASPLSFIGPRRRVPAPAPAPALPRIDAVLISHNHYDHLDLASVRELLRLNPRLHCYAPLGLGAWLRARGIAAVHELDWWQHREQDALEIHCVPAQHWSARGLFDRNRTLWCGWVVRAAGATFYFAGDTGYIAAAGARSERGSARPIWPRLPIGAYEPRWFMRSQHVDPPEAVRLHEELQVKRSLAIHWGTFELADDSLDTPVTGLASRTARARCQRGRLLAAAPG